MNDEFPTEKEHSAGDEGEKDLLGDPVDQKYELTGRPAYKVTEENQQVVRSLSAVGWKQERIATYLGIDAKTLRKHFSRELEGAADALEAEAIMAVVKRMGEGNMTAARTLLSMTEKGRANGVLEGTRTRSVAAEGGEAGDSEPLGKKEKKRQVAQAMMSGESGSLWARARTGSLGKPN